MIVLGDKVRLHGIRAEVVLAVVAVERIYDGIGQTLVITSVIDGERQRASVSYTRGAFTVGLPATSHETIRQRISNSLGPDFDVILEDPHIRIEWQPKEPG